MSSEFMGVLGNVGCNEVLRWHPVAVGGDWEAIASVSLARVVRASAALHGGKAVAYAIHDGLPPMAVVRCTSNGGGASVMREVPIAVVGHTPSLAAVQYRAAVLTNLLGTVRSIMGFSEARKVDVAGAPLEELAGVTDRLGLAWSLSSAKRIGAGRLPMRELNAAKPAVRVEAIITSQARGPMGATLCWAGDAANPNGTSRGIVQVELAEAPRAITRAYSALLAALDAYRSGALDEHEEIDGQPDSEEMTREKLSPIFGAGLCVRASALDWDADDGPLPTFKSLRDAIDWRGENRGPCGKKVSHWIVCDQHGVTAWKRPDLVPAALEKVALAVRAVERLVGRKGEVPHLASLAASLNALRHNADFTRKP